MKAFTEVQDWGKMRGLQGASTDMQYQRFLQEAVEIHEALVLNDDHEFKDAIGDTIVTLIMLAQTKGTTATECLQQAFGVIRLRKGLTINGSFVRYGKLDEPYREICDRQQGNPGNEYFTEESLKTLTPENFKV